MGALQTFEADTSPEQVVDVIAADGVAIVRDLLEGPEMARLVGELDPYLAASIAVSEGEEHRHTRRVGALLAKCPTTRDLVQHPLILAVTEQVLGPYCARFQINYTGVMYLDPGETAGRIHRDTGFYPLQNPCPPTVLATMWAMTDFTADNGATRLVLGSHRWHDDRAPLPEEIATAEMSAGSVLLYTGNTLHGPGANRSNAARGGLALHYALGWLRQEENQYLVMPKEEAARLPKRLQELMGYDLGTVMLGFVDHKHPNEWLNGTGGELSAEVVPEWLRDADRAIERIEVAGTRATGRTSFDADADPPA